MSWASLNATDFVTNNKVLDAIANGIFTVNSGQSISANNNFITTSEANTKLNIETISGVSTNFPVKTLFVAVGSSTVYYLVGTARTGSPSSGNACQATTGGFSIYTINSSGILNVGDSVYIPNGSGGYKLLDYSNDYLAYMQGSTKVWIRMNVETYSLIASKGNCKTVVSVYTGWNYDFIGAKNAVNVTSSKTVTSRLRIKVQLTGVNNFSGSPNPIMYLYIEVGQSYDYIYLNRSNVNNSASTTTILEIAIMIGATPTYPAEDSNYIYTF